MSSETEISVYIGEKMIATVSADVLRRFDTEAKQTPSTFRRIDEYVDEAAAHAILSWMQKEATKSSDQVRGSPAQPTETPDQAGDPSEQLEPLHPCGDSSSSAEPDFGTCLTLWHAAQAFTLEPQSVLWQVRELLHWYCGMSPLTCNEFVMLIEYAGDDRELFEEALARLRDFRRSGEIRGVEGVPEWDLIRMEFLIEQYELGKEGIDEEGNLRSSQY